MCLADIFSIHVEAVLEKRKDSGSKSEGKKVRDIFVPRTIFNMILLERTTKKVFTSTLPNARVNHRCQSASIY